jgi:hypothetical protein
LQDGHFGPGQPCTPSIPDTGVHRDDAVRAGDHRVEVEHGDLRQVVGQTLHPEQYGDRRDARDALDAAAGADRIQSAGETGVTDVCAGSSGRQ